VNDNRDDYRRLARIETLKNIWLLFAVSVEWHFRYPDWFMYDDGDVEMWDTGRTRQLKHLTPLVTQHMSIKINWWIVVCWTGLGSQCRKDLVNRWVSKGSNRWNVIGECNSSALWPNLPDKTGSQECKMATTKPEILTTAWRRTVIALLHSCCQTLITWSIGMAVGISLLTCLQGIKRTRYTYLKFWGRYLGFFTAGFFQFGGAKLPIFLLQSWTPKT